MKRMICFCMAFLLTLTFYGCRRSEKRILVVLPSKLDIEYAHMKQISEEWAEHNGLYIKVVAPSLPTAASQLQLMEEEFEREWDAVCIEPLGEMELSPVLEYQKDGGMLVVTIRGSIGCADYNIEPFSEERLGQRMMDALAQEMKGSGPYATFVASARDADTLCLEETAINEQKANYPDMLAALRLKQTQANKQSAKHEVQDAQTRYGIEGTLFFDTNSGIGIGEAQKNSDVDMAVVGVGTYSLLKNSLEQGFIDRLFGWDRNSLLLAALDITKDAMTEHKFEKVQRISLPYQGYESLQRIEGNTWQANNILEWTNNGLV